jgi:hypothetical protein
MTVTLELSLDDARCLRDHLALHMAEMDDELQMQHEIAVDVDRLQRIQKQLARLLAAAR